MVTGR
jgi:hypothetical protein